MSGDAGENGPLSHIDWTDPDVLQMVKRNHVPTEDWTMAGFLIGVRCETCGNGWPCPTVVRLRQEQ